ncbi:hypothetical protein GCK72_010309 [Caenorhabditis remanei]|uniref:Uncharacterized protein n=1 Tax=Caenorhabditis remanei TaxID=31234 RepID=A0A2P4VI96_CAERE|nr:hypothetical protein GCK72_010309 [Caenorhabditis remanei]KAF1762047.1 hypothetical protein GCK72_010309 [Caenorhabditis remanei]
MMAPSTEDPETVVDAQRRGSFSKKKNGNGWSLGNENDLAKNMEPLTDCKTAMDVDDQDGSGSPLKEKSPSLGSATANFIRSSVAPSHQTAQNPLELRPPSPG